MNEFETTSNDEIEIDLSRLFKALWRHAVVLLLAAILGAALLFSYSYFFITPKYTATATMYVNNGSSSSSTVTNSDLTASQSLVDTYIAILRTRLTMEQAIEQTGVSYTYEQLYGMVSASAVDETELFTISVTSTDPAEAALLANTLAELLPARIASLIEGTAAYIADYAVTPTSKSSPNVTMYTLVGLLLGLVIAVAVVLIRELTNDEIQQDEELMQLHPSIPILASIPDLKSQNSGGYGYGEKPASGKKQKKDAAAAEDGQDMVGEQLSFAAREAYKKLRTNLTLSLPDSGKCKVIGMTSSLAAEGKSTTSVNLAFSLAESGRRVLLLEADMRKPSQANRLGLERTPGLSNLLTGSCTMAEASQKISLHENLCVVTAGDIPPNPSELLSSGRMAECVKSFQEYFDYIVLDLPPISAVTDAVLAARLVDGLVLMVHTGYCRKPVLRDTLNQLSFTDAKLLGFVTTFNDIKSKGYGHYGRYGRYGYGYGYGYGEQSGEKHQGADK